MNWYSLSDRTQTWLNDRAIRRFERARKEGFDELNVIKATKQLYKDLDKDNAGAFLELAREQYESVDPSGDKPPDKAWLLAILALPNPLTKYIYDAEVYRKRDRAAEAVNASTAKVAEYRKALKYWSRMTGWYADIITDEAGLKSFRDAGVKKVIWRTQKDGKVCHECEERDGVEYPINNIPPKPHLGCRCYFTAVADKQRS